MTSNDYRRAELDNVDANGAYPAKLKITSDDGETKWLDITATEFEQIKNVLLDYRNDKTAVGVTGNEKSQTIDTIAELLWNADGSPAVSDEDYERTYKADAAKQYRDYETSGTGNWWVG